MNIARGHFAGTYSSPSLYKALLEEFSVVLSQIVDCALNGSYDGNINMY